MHLSKPQAIKHLTPNALRLGAMLLLFLHLTSASFAQHATGNGITFHESSPKQIAFEFNIFDIEALPFDSSFAIILTPAANSHSRNAGQPMLPVCQQIIRLPEDGRFTIEVTDQQWSRHTLQQLGCDKPLAPALPPMPKSGGIPPRALDSIGCPDSDCLGDKIVRIDTLGNMRGWMMARLTISPVRYDPTKRQIDVCHHLTATITFPEAPRKSANPLIPNVGNILNSTSKDYTNQLSENDSPQTYLIVAPLRFQQTLQPFVSWKRQEGYLVEEHYLELPQNRDIKAHLQQRYDNATPNRPAPLFILLVGDVQDIPVWVGTQHVPGIGGHRTDLYYAEFTGDCLPDALLGRISASDTATLAGIIAKTVSYERIGIVDSNALGRSLLVAGKEETPPAPTATNGQVNYLKAKLLQHDSQHDTICLYNPASDTMKSIILSSLQQGVAFVNYTSHCTELGWTHPYFRNNDLDTLSLNPQPFISINNCCRANDISADCFGEHLLRKTPGGAVGAIGASNETLWEEDYHWSVGGNTAPTLTPQYVPTLPGAYDRLFHTNGEPLWQQAATQSQIVTAGNWAVTASGSPYSNFYWEIYSLLGDPSLMPQIGIPAELQLDIDSIRLGDVQISLHGTPGARVAATRNDTLFAIGTIGPDSNGLISTILPVPDSLTFTATAQFHKALQKTVSAPPHTLPRIAVTSMSASNTDGEVVSQLTLRDSAIVVATIRNTGQATAVGHRVSINTSDQQEPALFTIASLPPLQDTTITFTVCPTTAANAMAITFECADSTTYWSHTRSLDILSAKTVITALTLQHNGTAVTSVKPSTDYDILIQIANQGTGRAKELTVSIDSCGNATLGDLDAGLTTQCTLPLTTPAAIDSLVLTVRISHRTDTSVATFTFPADTMPVPIPATDNATPPTVSPNPADAFTTFSDFTAPTLIVIHDLYGRVVDTIHTENRPTVQYSTSHLRCGVYSILFLADSTDRKTGRQTQKLIIAR